MKVKRKNLTDELMNYQDTVTAPWKDTNTASQKETKMSPQKKTSAPILINYQLIIQKQSQIIENLYKQCTVLRQKLSRIKSQQLFSAQNKQRSQINLQKFAQMVEGTILQQIGTLLQIDLQQISKNKITQAIKRIKWQRQKKAEPIFIQSIKEVRIPIPIQTVIQKIVQKIVIREKVVEVPVFRQIIVQRYVSQTEQNNEMYPKTSKLLSQGKQEAVKKIDQSWQQSWFSSNDSIVMQKSKQCKNQKEQAQRGLNRQNLKIQFYRPAKKQYQNYTVNKQLSSSDYKKETSNFNKTQIYDRNNEKQLLNKSYINSQGSKNVIRSPKCNRNGFKYDYPNDQYKYNYCEPQNYEQKVHTNDKTFHKGSYDHNKTIISFKIYPQQKQPYEGQKYQFDKNKFIDSNKTGGSKYAKKRQKYDYYEKER